MKHVLVSGCYDILHAGHIEFFHSAKTVFRDPDNTSLTVCIATDKTIRQLKGREPVMDAKHRMAVLSALKIVDCVFVGDDEIPELNFKRYLEEFGPDALVVTEDDPYAVAKRKLCMVNKVEYLQLSKEPYFNCTPTSTTIARRKASTAAQVPLRVDFAGGWLDVPKLARQDGYVVNCAISPLVSRDDWPYEKRSGLGGSAAHALLNGEDSVQSELGIAGWQDAAIVQETGVCVWRSGEKPTLDVKSDGSWLKGLMALMWTGIHHDTGNLLDRDRDYDRITEASQIAKHAVLTRDVTALGDAIRDSYRAQLDEGMAELDFRSDVPHKYLGSGHGGYVLCLFPTKKYRDYLVSRDENLIAIEPFEKWTNAE